MTPPAGACHLRRLPQRAAFRHPAFRHLGRHRGLWFLTAGIWALHHNRLYGDPALQNYNTFLFAAFVAKTFGFVFIFGGFSGDMVNFAGFLGLSISLNGGICRPARQTAAAPVGPPAPGLVRPRLQPAYQR